MNQRAIFLLCALLAGASSLAACDDGINFRSIDWTLLDGDYEPANEVTRNGMQLLMLVAGNQLETILNKINGPTLDSRYGDVYKDLKSLAEANDDCTENVISRVLEISSLMIPPSYRWAKDFAPFLKHYGLVKFGKCRPDAVRQIEEAPETKRVEEQLDQFYAALLGMEYNKLDEDEFLQALKSLDLAEDNYHAKKALEVAKKLDPRRTETDMIKFITFMADASLELTRKLRNAMSIITLADAFGYRTSGGDSRRVLKMKEYQRLHVSVFRKDLRQATYENLERLLSLPDSSKRKIGRRPRKA